MKIGIVAAGTGRMAWLRMLPNSTYVENRDIDALLQCMRLKMTKDNVVKIVVIVKGQPLVACT